MLILVLTLDFMETALRRRLNMRCLSTGLNHIKVDCSHQARRVQVFCTPCYALNTLNNHFSDLQQISHFYSCRFLKKYLTEVFTNKNLSKVLLKQQHIAIQKSIKTRPGQGRCMVTLARALTNHIKSTCVVCRTPRALYGVLPIFHSLHSQ